MKKILAGCLAAALVLQLAACGKGQPAQSAADSKPASSASSASSVVSEAESKPESQPASSAASEEEKAASSQPEQDEASSEASSVQSLPADTVAMKGGPAQVDAMVLPLGKKVQVEVNGSRRWFAFTTGSAADYEVWLAPGGQYYRTIGFGIYNRRGELVWESNTNGDGSVTVRQVQLSPDTPYFATVAQSEGNHGALTFRLSPLTETGDASSGASSEETAGSAAQSQAEGILDLEGGSAQGGATAFQLEQMVRAKVNGSRKWYSFATGDGTDYEILLAPEGQYYRTIGFSLYNELGEQVWESGTNGDGSVTIRQIQLSPNTTYYGVVSQEAGNDGNLIFRVSAHFTPQDTATEVEREPETVSELIFEEPFSLDETQIMFVSNKAIFVDEEAAKAALAPVAEVILAHPDHPVLLAGTTATDGQQESCVRLSSQRAEAVKNLLVSAYGVPEDQLLTVGLGYEADPFPRGQDRDSSGNFVESEAVKNRRVVVLDANDPTAQEILNA